MRQFAVVIALFIVSVNGQLRSFRPPIDGGINRNDDRSDLAQPTPYEFAYTSENEEGTHGHSEKFDGVSRAEGNYFLKLADGRERHVTYVADESGFHPEIQTNELGTESKNPADVVYISSALSGPDAAIAEYGGPFPESVGNQGPARAQAPAGGVVRSRAPIQVVNPQLPSSSLRRNRP